MTPPARSNDGVTKAAASGHCTTLAHETQPGPTQAVVRIPCRRSSGRGIHRDSAQESFSGSWDAATPPGSKPRHAPAPWRASVVRSSHKPQEFGRTVLNIACYASFAPIREGPSHALSFPSQGRRSHPSTALFIVRPKVTGRITPFVTALTDGWPKDAYSLGHIERIPSVGRVASAGGSSLHGHCPADPSDCGPEKTDSCLVPPCEPSRAKPEFIDRQARDETADGPPGIGFNIADMVHRASAAESGIGNKREKSRAPDYEAAQGASIFGICSHPRSGKRWDQVIALETGLAVWPPTSHDDEVEVVESAQTGRQHGELHCGRRACSVRVEQQGAG